MVGSEYLRARSLVYVCFDYGAATPLSPNSRKVGWGSGISHSFLEWRLQGDALIEIGLG
jgi:hypothetical protein